MRLFSISQKKIMWSLCFVKVYMYLVSIAFICNGFDYLRPNRI